MNQYSFRIMNGAITVGEGYGEGVNALEAFEFGVKNGTLIFESGKEFDILSISLSGLGIRFKAIKFD